jgi:hypothetical protein
MLSSSKKQAIFFSVAFVISLVILSIRGSILLNTSIRNMEPWIANVLASIFLTAIFAGLFFALKPCENQENFWEVSLPAQCKGGPFFWENGDSELSKRCRELASTPEGRCQLSSYQCPKGYVGTPRQPFWYSPLSNDEWKNERCDDCGDPMEILASQQGSAESKNCPCVQDGLCSFVKQSE